MTATSTSRPLRRHGHRGRAAGRVRARRLHVADPLDELRADARPQALRRPAAGAGRAPRAAVQPVDASGCRRSSMSAKRRSTCSRPPRRWSCDGCSATARSPPRSATAPQRDAAALQRQHDELGRFKRDDRGRPRGAHPGTPRSAASAAQRDVDRAEQREGRDRRRDRRHPETVGIARDGHDAVEWAQPAASSTTATSSRSATPSSRHAPRRRPHVRATPRRAVRARSHERHRYDELAGDLEDWRLRHDVDVERDGPLGPAGRRPPRSSARDARRRASASRAEERGLPGDPPGALKKLEPETIELDFDI